MGSERISIGRDGGLAHVELAREGKSNAMDHDMFEAIGEAFRSLGADPTVRAILLSGRGRHFTAGLDLQYASSQFPPSDDPGRAAEARLRHIKWLQDAFTAAEEARPPISSMDGWPGTIVSRTWSWSSRPGVWTLVMIGGRTTNSP